MPLKNGIKRVLKSSGIIVSALAAVILLVILLMFLRPVREMGLGWIVTKVSGSLPGSLVVERSKWPSPGTLQFEHATWSDGIDTLGSMDNLRLSIDLSELFRGDIHVREMAAAGVVVDFPAILGRFPAGADGGTPRSEPDEGRAFPREGSVPGIISIAADRIEIHARHVRLSKDFDLKGLKLIARADVLRDSAPSVDLLELSLDETSRPVSIDSLWLHADLKAPGLNGGGVLRIQPGMLVFLRCSSNPDSTFDILLSSSRGIEPPQAIALSANGRAAVHDRRLESVDFELEFLTPGRDGLVKYPILSGPLARIGSLEGLHGAGRGRLDLIPSLSLEADLTLGRTSWMDTLCLFVSHTKEATVLDTLLLEMPGLLLSASGSSTTERANLSAHIRADSTTWLAAILPDLNAPDKTSAKIDAGASYNPVSRETRVTLMGNAVAAGTIIDSLYIDGTVPAGKDSRYMVDIMLETKGTKIITSASADLSSVIDVTLSRPARSENYTGAVYLTGHARVERASRMFSVEGLRAEGAWGIIAASAEIDSLGNGWFDMNGEWPVPPAVLQSSIGIDTASWDGLASRWASDGPFEINARGSLTGSRTGRGVSAKGSARLPGPRVLAPLADGTKTFDDLGAVLAGFKGSFKTTGGRSRYGARVDMSETEWIDTALIQLSGGGKDLSLDTAVVVFEGLSVSAGGEISAGLLDIDANLSLADSQLVKRLGALAGSEISMALDMRLAISGETPAPSIGAGFEGRFSTAGLDIPLLTGQVSSAGGIVHADLAAPEGLHAGIAHFSSVHVDYGRGKDAGAAILLEARGLDTDILVSARIPVEEEFTVITDTLHVGVSGLDITSRNPFTISALEGGGIDVDSLILRGNIGIIEAAGMIAPDSADFAAHVSVVMPEKPGMLDIADRLWPDSVLINLSALDRATLTAEGGIYGIAVGKGISTDLDFGLISDRSAVQASLLVTGPEKEILSLEGRLPPLDSDGSMPDGPFALDVKIDGAPVSNDLWAFAQGKQAQIGILDGRMAARGSISDPQAVINLNCSFLGGREIEKYTLTVDGIYAPGGLSDTTLLRLIERRGGTAGPAATLRPGTEGLSAGLKLNKSGRTMLNGTMLYPLTVSLKPVSFVFTKTGEILLKVESSDLPLNDLDPILPPDVDLEGLLNIDVRVSGGVNDPDIEGRLQTRNMSLSVAEKLRMSPDVNMTFGGTVGKPWVKGDILINRGLLMMPEPKKNLLAAEGKAVLWEAADSFFTEADMTGVGPEGRPDRKDAQNKGLRELDLDVIISIPNSFLIRSERLNLEMEGNLRVQQKGGSPVVTGELKPRTGRLLFMGRYFQIERGGVFFYGGDEMDPSFDLTLTSSVSDIDIEIKLTGTAQKPRIALNSNPPMSESDIMSLLLFGKSIDDLNGSQSKFLQQRTAEILLVFGAARLEGEMSRRLGVDTFNFQQSTRDPEKAALSVGKYINRRTMLRYEQGLENTANFLINLEYHISRQLKLETFIDQNSETGIELNWSREY